MSEDHVPINRDYWNAMAGDWVALGERIWALDRPVWGIWNTPDATATLLPANMAGSDVIELGCGTGYVSAWMNRRGARVTGIDASAEQLATARRLAGEYEADITFIEGNAEDTSLPDTAFDFVVSEYGAAIWCDPAIWLREAWRLLRPVGRVAFLGSHPLVMIATPESGDVADFKLHRPYRGLDRLDWTEVEIDPGGIEFNRSFEGWLRQFREIGFAVLDYRELYAPVGATDAGLHVTAEWSRNYPAEQVWWLEKPS